MCSQVVCLFCVEIYIDERLCTILFRIVIYSIGNFMDEISDKFFFLIYQKNLVDHLEKLVSDLITIFTLSGIISSC